METLLDSPKMTVFIHVDPIHVSKKLPIISSWLWCGESQWISGGGIRDSEQVQRIHILVPPQDPRFENANKGKDDPEHEKEAHEAPVQGVQVAGRQGLEKRDSG